jgi:transposase
MGNVTTVGIDLAKNVFSLHGVDASGGIVLRKTVSRVRLMEVVAQQPACLIGNDAEAICEAVSRLSMRFVPIKTLEQQAVLCLHRVRQGFIEERTATINRLRGLLAEFGVVLPQKTAEVRRRATEWLEQLPPRAACALRKMRDTLNCPLHALVRRQRAGPLSRNLN